MELRLSSTNPSIWGIILLQNSPSTELEVYLFDKKKYKHDTISQRVHDSMGFLSGDPYKGAERTACPRATHGYYNA